MRNDLGHRIQGLGLEDESTGKVSQTGGEEVVTKKEVSTEPSPKNVSSSCFHFN